VGAVRAARAGAAALCGALLLLLASLSPAAAAEPTFGEAVAVGTFGESIEVQQPATLPERPKRIEAVVREGFDPVTFLAEIPNPGAGSTTLHYRDATPFGSVYPNTSVELGFRLTFDDGRVVDSPTTTLLYEDTRFEWRAIEGSLVRLHWYKGTEGFARRALEIGEKGVESASQLFGVKLDEPVDFFVYGDSKPFEDVLGPAQRENVGGLALPEIRTMFARISPDQVAEGALQLLVAHELTHLVFDRATHNPYHQPAHWLNEGLADYVAIGYTAGARANVENAARTGAIMPLRALVGRFPTSAEGFGLGYDESVAAVDYLIRTYGQEALGKLVRSYAEGLTDAAAFKGALGVDDAAFEAGWFADLGIDEPAPYGPLPAPAGPLPPGWQAGPAPTPAGSGPIATPRPGSRPDGPAGTILLAGLVVLAVLLIIGLLVVARNLSRGEPLMPPLHPERAPEDEADESDAPGAAPRDELEPPPGDDR
jgi:peptidase MA superfamily protein